MNQRLVYLHGFASGGNSEKGRLLRATLTDREVLTPTLDPSPAKAAAQVEALLVPGIVLVGTSLGGFYSHLFHRTRGIPAVLLNPLVDPADIRGYIGTNTNFQTGEAFEFTHADWAALEDFRRRAQTAPSVQAPLLVLTAEDDELLDYRKAFGEYSRPGQRVITVPAGGHRFTDQSRLIAELTRFLGEL